MPKISLKDLMPIIEESFSRGQSITIPVTGKSMEPILSSGDAVTLVPPDWKHIERGDILLYRRANGQFVLHRVVCVKKNSVNFCGDAQVAVEKGIPKDSVIAQVVAYEKDGCNRDLEFLRKEGKRRNSTRFIRRIRAKLKRFQTHDRTNDKEAIRFIVNYLKRHIPSIIALCLLSVVAAVASLAMAMVSGVIIDKTLNPSSSSNFIIDQLIGLEMNHFREWFYLLFGLLLVVAASNIAYSNVRVRVVERIKNEMREDLFATLLTKNYSSVQDLHSGDILNRLTNDLQAVVDTACTFIPNVLSIAAKLIGGLGFMLFVEPIFTTLLIILGILIAFCLQFCGRFYKSVHKDCQNAEGQTRSFLQECTQNMMVIKSFDNEKGILRALNGYQQRHYKKQLRRNFFGNIGNTTVYTAFTLAYYSGLAWGVLRMGGFIGTVMTVGTFTAFLQVMEQIRSPFRNASGVLPQLYSMLASADRLLDLRRLPKENRPILECSAKEIYDTLEYIEFSHIDFSYDAATVVLEDACCRFHKGDLTAVVGGSGIGKSTLIKLLLGLVEPQNGHISLRTTHDNIDISASTRCLFSYVPQGNMVLSGTLAQNIAFGREGITLDEIERAVQLSCLTEVVERLPKGLHTVIGERGVGLSEGQIQRLAIARALISKAPILLLDECTSALDAATEMQVIQNLSSLKDRTILCISHRTAILEHADKVVEIKEKKFTNIK